MKTIPMPEGPAFLANGEIFDLLATRAQGELHMLCVWGEHNLVVPYKGAIRALAKRMVEIRPDLDLDRVSEELAVVHMAFVVRGTNLAGVPYPQPIEIPSGPIAKDRL
jgi:hypothetical protein